MRECSFRSHQALVPADSAFPHPALRATFSRWEKEKNHTARKYQSYSSVVTWVSNVSISLSFCCP
jgi:hypothetical protein